MFVYNTFSSLHCKLALASNMTRANPVRKISSIIKIIGPDHYLTRNKIILCMGTSVVPLHSLLPLFFLSFFLFLYFFFCLKKDSLLLDSNGLVKCLTSHEQFDMDTKKYI